MSLMHRDIAALSEDDLNGLITDSVREEKSIEYKEELPGGTDDEKREFLSDVSSFANASGGDLFYGVREKRDAKGNATGEPERLKPLTINVDAESLRLQEFVQSSIAPRIPGILLKAIPIKAGGHILLLRTPKSWLGLHMVTFKNLSRFYSRNSNGKYQLDVNEIRTGFVTAETGHQRLQHFRLERVSRIVANEGPIHLAEGPKVILHLIPLSSLDPTVEWDLKRIHDESSLRPMYSSGWSRRYNFEGVLSHTSYSKDQPVHSYAQLFRNGTIEACATHLMRDDKKVVPTQSLEQEIIRSIQGYLILLKSLGVPEPLVLFLSINGLAGYTLAVPSSYFVMEHVPIRENMLLFPEASIDAYGRPADSLLQPVFDQLWNAAGWERSIYYDDKGKWIGHK